MNALNWIISNWQIITGLVAVVFTWWLTRKYILALTSNDALIAEINHRNAMQLEKNRIEISTHTLENSLDDDKPVDKPKGDIPGKFTISVLLCLMIMGCSHNPVLVKPELPVLRTYNPQHIPVDFIVVGDKICTGNDNYYNMVQNEEEYKRVISSYEKQTLLYNDFLKSYYSDKK